MFIFLFFIVWIFYNSSEIIIKFHLLEWIESKLLTPKLTVIFEIENLAFF